jgi:hypothetical protein
MSLSLPERVRLAEQASAERAFKRLAEADTKLDDCIQWVMCDCDQCRANRTGARLLKAKPVVNRKLIGRLGILLVAASALALFLILKGLPILRALNY